MGAMAPTFQLIVCGRMVQAVGSDIMMPLVNVLAMEFAITVTREQLVWRSIFHRLLGPPWQG